jgi:hypothetical protein
MRPYSDIRCSDAERERVVSFLREHALAGRLNDDELEERIGLAYAAVTVGDLERLIGDLPRSQPPAQRWSRPPARRREPTPALIAAGIALLVVTGLPMVVIGVGIALLAVVLALSFALGPFILIALLIVAGTRRRHRPPPMRWGRA